MRSIILTFVFLSTPLFAVEPPLVVATPPADAGRGLIRISDKEIRHYSGKGGKQFLRSRDNGESWKLVSLPRSYPAVTCLPNESPAIANNPVTGEFIRFEPLYRGKNKDDGIYLAGDGIDGSWTLLRDQNGHGVKPGGILRNPLWVNDNKRIILPSHGGGCWTWYSDDQGRSWKQSNKINSPPHKAGGIHKGTRWNHGMVEATVVELKNKTLWMIARTAQDQHYESFSTDFGATWSEAKPSRFWGTITMPTFHRLSDGRLLFLWTNTASLPEKESATGRWEDVFTNRDAIHAAISEDDGKTWIGFREIILDELRNEKDYGVTKGGNDRGKHQAEVIELDKNRVLLSCGQHPLHRRLIIMDLRWLYQKERHSNLANESTQDWSTHQYIEEIVGHCSYNRKPGAKVKGGALRILRVKDSSLTHQNQGATWNFPAGYAGKITLKIRLERGGAGAQIALTDRWFNPSDPTVAHFANYVLEIDREGKTKDGKLILTPGKIHELALIWQDLEKEPAASLIIDGKMTDIKLPCLHPCPNGISYLHLYNPATETDLKGFSLFSTHAQIK